MCNAEKDNNDVLQQKNFSNKNYPIVLLLPHA